MLTVSVIIPVFNAGRFLEAAVASCLSLGPVREVLLIDDGSQDDSLARAATLAAGDPRVRVLHHADGGNRGAAATRNRGLDAAQGDLVAFLDADDWYLPNRFAASMPALAADSTVDGVYEPVDIAFEDAGAREEWFRRNDFEVTFPRIPVPPERLFEVLAGGREGYIHLNGLLLRRFAAARLGGFHPDIKLVEDTEYCLRAAARCRLQRLDGPPVAVRRLHGANSILGPLWQARRPQIVAMWQRLLDWALVEGLGPAHLDAVADAYLSAAERGDGDNRFTARAALRLCALGEVLRRHPCIVRRRCFWKHAARALDVSKLRYAIRGVPAS